MPRCLGRLVTTHGPSWASWTAVLCPGTAADLADRLSRNYDITGHPSFVRKRAKHLGIGSGADLELRSPAGHKLTQVLLRCAPNSPPLVKEDLSSVTASDFQRLRASFWH